MTRTFNGYRIEATEKAGMAHCVVYTPDGEHLIETTAGFDEIDQALQWGQDQAYWNSAGDDDTESAHAAAVEAGEGEGEGS